jgi:hypothetical protein
MVTDWTSFKEEFKIYIVNTIGLFEINTPLAVCFDLDRFLIRQYESVINNKQIAIRQFKLLTALLTFIDILETKQKVDINIFSKETIIYLNLLIDTKYIAVNSSSNIFKDIMNYHKTNNKYEIEI